MNPSKIMSYLTMIIDDAKAAVLTTASRDGRPHVRWVTPLLLPEHPRSVFMVTSPHFAKVGQISENPYVEWMFQTRSLDTIVNLSGTMEILEHPGIRSEVLEKVAPRLQTFATINPAMHDTVVLITYIETAHLFLPAKGIRKMVDFKGGSDE